MPPPPPRSARRATTSPEPWPTALLTLPAPVYQPLVDPAPAAADRRPRRRLALGALSAALAAAGLALALWQLYFFLESTGSGRALLDRLAGFVAAVAARF